MIDSFSGEYRWLSNFWPCQVEMGGLCFSTVEHAYQAAKTLSLKERAFVQAASTPGEAKKRGRGVTIRPEWDAMKVELMRSLLWEKFEAPDLREKLLLTGEQPLVEGNYWGDRFWGVCRGEGENHLGKLLMDIREELRGF